MERIVSLDRVRAVCIVLVVFCHYPMLNSGSILGNLVMTLAWAAVPCFFLVSGYLLLRNKTFDWKKYAKRLLRVYGLLVIWKALYFLYFAIVGNVTVSAADLFKYLFLPKGYDGVNTNTLWFLYAYLLAVLLLPVIHWAFHHSNRTRVQLGCIAGLIAVVFLGNNVSFRYATYLCMLVYFVLGALLYSAHETLQRMFTGAKKALPPILALIGLGLLLYARYNQVGSLRWEDTYLTDGYRQWGTLLLSLGLFLTITYCIPETNISSFFSKVLGQNTLGIYLLHLPVLDALIRLTTPALLPFYSFALAILECAFVLAICASLTILAKKIPGIRYLVS